MNASAVATQHTKTFITENLAPDSTTLLEIGAGNGELALALSESGYEVTALDSRPAAVAACRAKGLTACEARWPDWQGSRVDAVLFTRSLHHIPPLDDAVRQAANHLKPGGRLLVEDFAFADATPALAGWFQNELALLQLGSLLQIPESSFVARMLRHADPLQAWRHDHMDDLHRADAMNHVLNQHFTDVQQTRTCYLYRYLIQVVGETAAGAELVRLFFNQEQHLAALLPDFAIGRRWVARSPH